MVMIIIHISYITCLVTNDAWHANGVIVVYKMHDEAGRISCFAEPAMLWLAGTLIGPVEARSFLTELVILRLARTVMGEVWFHNRGACPPGQLANTVGQKKYCID